MKTISALAVCTGIAAGCAGTPTLTPQVNVQLAPSGTLRVAHTGPFGRDPMAIEISERSIALRRRDASHITIERIA